MPPAAGDAVEAGAGHGRAARDATSAARPAPPEAVPAPARELLATVAVDGAPPFRARVELDRGPGATLAIDLERRDGAPAAVGAAGGARELPAAVRFEGERFDALAQLLFASSGLVLRLISPSPLPDGLAFTGTGLDLLTVGIGALLLGILLLRLHRRDDR